MPRLSNIGLVFALASLGLPGFGTFVAEFMVLIGSFRLHPAIASCAASGLVLSAIYALWIVQRTFHGIPAMHRAAADLTLRETGMMAVLIIAILWLGLFPGHVLDLTDPFVNASPCCASFERTISGGGI